jgi:hypothetical protein
MVWSGQLRACGSESAFPESRDSKPPIWERRSYKIIESTGQQLLALFPKFLVRIDPPKRFINGNALTLQQNIAEFAWRI